MFRSPAIPTPAAFAVAFACCAPAPNGSGTSGGDTAATGAPTSAPDWTARPADAATTSRFRCEGLAFTVRTVGPPTDEALVLLPDARHLVRRVPSASGTRYEGDGLAFWSHGDEARLETPGATYDACSLDRGAAAFEAARLRGAVFRALGQEPGWYLEILPDSGRMALVADYGETELRTPLPEPRIDEAAGLRTYEAATGSHRLTVTIESRPCTDAMSGFPFPRTVTVTLDGRALDGCGRPLGPAFVGAWDPVRLGDSGATSWGATSALGFDAWGRVTATSGCNDLFGAWRSEGPGRLEIGPLTATEMACPPGRTDRERGLAEALRRTRGFRLRADTLRLIDASGATLGVFAARPAALEGPGLDR